jgi:AraC-like DNA-binding protein
VRTTSSRTRNSNPGFVRGSGTNTTIPDGGLPHAKAAIPFSSTSTILDERVQKILRMVASGTTFSTRDLAFEFHLSPSYLQRLFKNQTGVSMGEWLNEQKLQRAASLLLNSFMSVKEVAYSIGYEHASSFIRAFERRFTQAPAHYRKQSHNAKC